MHDAQHNFIISRLVCPSVTHYGLLVGCAVHKRGKFVEVVNEVALPSGYLDAQIELIKLGYSQFVSVDEVISETLFLVRNLELDLVPV